MRLIEVNTEDGALVRRFLRLPFEIYRDVPQWVPPLAPEARRILDRKRNPFFRHSQASFFLVEDRNGKDLGRIAVLDNRRYNKHHQTNVAFFYLFECTRSREAAEMLLDAAFGWARQKGLTTIFGPKGFTPMDGLGLLVKGFEHRPAFGIPFSPPYYPSFFDEQGFEPARDLVSGYMHRGIEFPKRIHQIADRVRERRGLRIMRFRSRSDLRALVPKFKTLYNSALAEVGSNPPLTDEEVGAIANQLLWFSDPSLIKVVAKRDEPIGFVMAYPDVSAAVQRTRGRLFPLGWITLLRELRRTEWVNLNGAGIIKEYRGLGGTAILFSEMAKTLIESDFEHADLVQVGTENDRMQRELRTLGVDFYKTHRVYERAL